MTLYLEPGPTRLATITHKISGDDHMKLVIIESPYAGDIETNVTYAKSAVHDCLLRGEAPIASHLLFTQPGILDDGKPEERKLGIAAGLAWHEVCDTVVFYTDRGWSRGMDAAREHALSLQIPIENRTIEAWQSIQSLRSSEGG